MARRKGMRKAGARFKSKKGISLAELVITIALLSVFAAASTAIVWVVMQVFQTNTDLSVNRQNIVEAQDILHNMAEVAESIEVITAPSGPSTEAVHSPDKGDSVLMLTPIDGRYGLQMYVYTETGNKLEWQPLAAFDGIEAAKFELTDSTLTADAGRYRFSYTFISEKGMSYTGGVEVNNMTEGTPFYDGPDAVRQAVRYDSASASEMMICFRM